MVHHTLPFVSMLFLLIAAHGLADFPWQGQFMSDAKNPNHPSGKLGWPIVLGLHGVIHGSLVFLITGSLTLGVYEVLLHCGIDYVKCNQRISFRQDQFLHISCKVAWAVLAYFVPHLA